MLAAARTEQLLLGPSAAAMWARGCAALGFRKLLLNDSATWAIDLLTSLRNDPAGAPSLVPPVRPFCCCLRRPTGEPRAPGTRNAKRVNHELLELLVQEERGEPMLVPRGREVCEFPLSFGQQRLWFLKQFAPEESVYNESGALRIKGPLDVTALARGGAEPERAKHIAFTAAYCEIEATYLVPAGSPIQSIEEVDREGIRIAVSQRSAYELWLSDNIEHAELVMAQGIDASFDTFVEQELDALAGLRPRLVKDVERLPGARILDGKFTAVQQAIGTKPDRKAGAAFLRDFVEEVKASGFVAGLIEKHGVTGRLTVAPPA